MARLQEAPELIAGAARLSHERRAAAAREERQAAYARVSYCQMRAARARAAYEAGVWDLHVPQASLDETAQGEAAAREHMGRGAECSGRIWKIATRVPYPCVRR